MSDNGYTQFIYVSTATFGDGNIEAPATQRAVFRIVRQSRANNPAWGVVGALLFGDGHFLQVLEGREEDIDNLTSVIFADERHTQPTVLRRSPVEAPRFGNWSMKFPTMGEELRSVLALDREGRFDPYGLADRKLDTLIDHLQANEDSVV